MRHFESTFSQIPRPRRNLPAARAVIAGCIAFAVITLCAGVARAQVVTEFKTGITPLTKPQHITSGADGNLWFTEGSILARGAVARITPLGVVTEFTTGITAPGEPLGIAAGPDGNLWFGEFGATRVGRITPVGVVTEFSHGISSPPLFMAPGPDGNMWFTEFEPIIGRITPAGVVTEFSTGITSSPALDGITAGPDGNLWFTEGFQSRDRTHHARGSRHGIQHWDHGGRESCRHHGRPGRQLVVCRTRHRSDRAHYHGRRFTGSARALRPERG